MEQIRRVRCRKNSGTDRFAIRQLQVHAMVVLLGALDGMLKPQDVIMQHFEKQHAHG